MDRKQALVIVFVFVCVFLAMGLAVYFSRDQEPGAVSRSAAPRFTAKPGTTREQAVALTSSRRESGVDSYGGGAEASAEDGAIAVQSLSKDQETFARDTARAIVEAAQSGATPAEASLLLAEAAREASDPDVKVLLHLALAETHEAEPAQTPEAVLAAFEEAARIAGNTPMKLLVAWHRTQYLIRLGRTDEALATIAETLADVAGGEGGRAATAGELQLRVLQGDLLRDLARLDEAAEAYRAAVTAGLDMRPAPDPAWADALRLAGLRLSRLYRAQGRHEDAEEIGRQVRNRLVRIGATEP